MLFIFRQFEQEDTFYQHISLDAFQQVKTQQDPITIDQVRIVPHASYHVVEIIYHKEPVQAQVHPSFYVAIDLGVTNLAAITSNRAGFIPRLVNGRPLKALNQWYNKRMKELTLRLPKAEQDRVTKQMQRITAPNVTGVLTTICTWPVSGSLTFWPRKG